MTNEELQAKYESLNSIEDAYALMKENGYSGTMEDFIALCTKAAEEIGPMDMDAMDDVAGGISWEGIKEGASDVWDATKNGFSKGVDWVKANPELTAGIVGGVAVAAIGITYTVKHFSAEESKYETKFSGDPKNWKPGEYKGQWGYDSQGWGHQFDGQVWH